MVRSNFPQISRVRGRVRSSLTRNPTFFSPQPEGDQKAPLHILGKWALVAQESKLNFFNFSSWRATSEHQYSENPPSNLKDPSFEIATIARPSLGLRRDLR
ncbi:hypothetical protein PoB_000439200 [Plakobranchus ocellatus]|uniref:Uncharacterized protein n=1 Tax=Plakobranchus ocellatus TaxID=259542 RepID=A0AAV3Y704_9GAST|nr:hypothetical protein PoB_000439200 [Plakobranchus ocellatus]